MNPILLYIIYGTIICSNFSQHEEMVETILSEVKLELRLIVLGDDWVLDTLEETMKNEKSKKSLFYLFFSNFSLECFNLFWISGTMLGSMSRQYSLLSRNDDLYSVSNYSGDVLRNSDMRFFQMLVSLSISYMLS